VTVKLTVRLKRVEEFALNAVINRSMDYLVRMSKPDCWFLIYHRSIMNFTIFIPLIDVALPRQVQISDNLPVYYNIARVHRLWVQCIKYGIVFLDPVLAGSESDYLSVCDRLEKLITIECSAESSGSKRFLPLNETYFNSLSSSDQKEYAICHRHELAMFQLEHKMCHKCRSVSLMKNYSVCRVDNEKHVCSECKQKQEATFYKKDCNRLLPVWYDDDGSVQFELPEELKDLRLGEQLLIQRFSCFVPLVHIKNGTMGIKGHCCCFKQDLADVCNDLPRTKVNAVKVIKAIRQEIGSSIAKSFYIRRDKVMNALKWLKKYHKWYREDPDLVINENNLDWMDGASECELVDLHTIQDSSDDHAENHHGSSSDIFVDECIGQKYGELKLWHDLKTV
jgi:hypothetical protein